MNPSALRIAVAAYGVEFLDSWQHYADKLDRWVGDAAGDGATLLLFPEYASMELASLFEPAVRNALDRQLQALQTHLPDFIDLHARLAREYGVTIVAGSFPVAIDSGVFHNRAHVFTPTGDAVFQDKIQMTRFENEQWMITGATELNVIALAAGTIGIDICYDIEFPLLARAQVAGGADLLLAPSCTDTRAGYERVRLGCRARALENQCFVAQASLVGDAPWSPAIDVNCGAAGIYAPVDRGFPDDGVIAEGAFNVPGWTYADLDLAALAAVRAAGQVFNYRDWDGQEKVRLSVVRP